MKKIFLLLSIMILFFNCSEPKKSIHFIELNDAEFNAGSFKLDDSIAISKKRSHDSCMGFSFNANAIFIKRKDTFFVGTILNRQSLQVVNSISSLGFTIDELVSKFNMLANPCFEKQTLHISLKSVLENNFNAALPGAGKAVNDELMSYINSAQNTEIRTGQWVYLDFANALITMMDTAQSPAFIAYKKDLLDTNNMALTATENVTNVSFFVSTKKDMSAQLQSLLKEKPVIAKDARTAVQLYFLNSQAFQINIDGFFPVAGQFMKAALQ